MAFNSRPADILLKIPHLILVCVFAFLFLAGGDQEPTVRPDKAVREELLSHQENDNLGEWVYTLLSWANRKPAANIVGMEKEMQGVWRGPQNPDEIQAWLDLLVNKGYLWLVSGDIVASTDAYNQAFSWALAHKDIADDQLVLEHILKPLGNNYTRLGDYEQAMFIHRKALLVEQAMNNAAAMAGTYSNMANAAAGMAQPELALSLCRQGLKAAGNNAALKGLLYSEMADATMQLGNHDSAWLFIQKSVGLLEPFSEDPDAGYWLLMALQVAGDISINKPEQSERLYHKALVLQERLLKKNGNVRTRERAKLFHRLSVLYLRENKLTPAAQWADSCLGLLLPGKTFSTISNTDLYGENTLVDLLNTRAGIAMAAGEADNALNLFHTCFAAERKLRREYVTGAAKEKAVSDSRQRYALAIALAYSSWEEKKDPRYRREMLTFIERSKAQLLLEDLLQEEYLRTHGTHEDSIITRIRLLERALVFYDKEAQQQNASDSLNALRKKQALWDLAALRKKYAATVSLPAEEAVFYPDSMPAVLDKTQRLRSFFMWNDALYVTETDYSGIRFAEKIHLPDFWQDTVKAFVQNYFESGPEQMMNDPEAYYKTAFRLYTTMMGKHPLDSGFQYILLPDGVLNRLPVEALVVSPKYTAAPEKWPFVVKRAMISYAYSMQTFRQQLSHESAGEGISGFFITHTNRQLIPLEAVLREKEAVETSVKNGDWKIDKEATVSAFKSAMSKSSLVHISTHASSEKDSLAAPRIELYDAPFYLFEWKALRSHPAMVVLSACQTGDGKLIAGEGVQSLARAFTAGGTNAVVAGWWNVNDEAAASLMKEFYAALSSGKQAATSLRYSKLEWLAAAEVSYIHKLPYYWAALNYHGNPSPFSNGIITGATTSYKWWLWGLAIASLSAFVCIAARSGFMSSRR